ncbi:MAG: PHP domain-containing protein [Anaerolineae bacterium]|nr:PHP domain-containing protein [Anaerolineae bacterium]
MNSLKYRKADLHMHSFHSGYAGDPFLRAIGMYDSYCDPEEQYQRAVERGMDFVTLTDHDQISGVLALKERHPERVFTGLESTVSFPDGQVKIHVLVYGLNETDYHMIEKVRHDVFQFRDYIRERGLAHSVAHALLRMGRVLTLDHLEQLALLFNVFEGINGSQSRRQNDAWVQYLMRLTPEKYDQMYYKHRIEPFNATPWMKSFTGGSDDHAGLITGGAWTETKAENVAEYVEALKRGRCHAEGAHSTYQEMALTIMRAAYEWGARRPHSKLALPAVRNLVDNLFDGEPIHWWTRLQLHGMRFIDRIQSKPLRSLSLSFVDELVRSASNADSRGLYQRVTRVTDQGLARLLDLKTDGLMTALKRSAPFALMGVALSAPFYATTSVMNRSQELVRACQGDGDAGEDRSPQECKCLWFTDDLAAGRAMPLEPGYTLVTTQQVPDAVVLPTVGEIEFPAGSGKRMRIPSLLASLEQLNAYDIDEVYIASAGPVGVLGLLMARILKVPAVGLLPGALVEAPMTSSEHSLWTEGFQKWLNGQMDRLVVGQVVESETGIGWRLNRLRDPEPQGAYQLMG